MGRVLGELAAEVLAALQVTRWRLATAESCTGGLVGHLLTEVPGSSTSYVGGVIAYHNAVKHLVLGVSAQTLEAAGAVSEACAVEMAAGARRLLGAEVAVSTTGIAGPGGGTMEKPVGLVYVAVVAPTGSRCERYIFDGNRSDNKNQAARRGLELILELLGTPNR